MVRRWINHLGIDEAIKLMTWNNTDPCFSIRFTFPPYKKLLLLFFVCLFLSFRSICLLSLTMSCDDYRANTGKGFTRADLVGELEKLKVVT